MKAAGNRDTLGRARLSFASEAEVEEFVATLERFERGELGADQWRAFRLVHGTYTQRQPGDVQMLRVKIPQGVLDGPQLEALAEVAERYSRGFGHITTRQNVQFHFVRLHDVEPAMRRVGDAGLTTREACGNAVRNITACPYAGVAEAELFDVTPYAEALTRFLLRHPLASTLPRKFKIAFEACPTDHAVTAINDIGWRARLREEDGRLRPGFRVTVGGGTSILCRSGSVLFDFLPAGRVLALAEAVLRVYHRLGDYQHKQRNRLKFLIRSLGWERWQAEVRAELERVETEGAPCLPFDPDAPPAERPPERGGSPAPSAATIRRMVSRIPPRGPGLLPLLSDAEAGGGPDELMAWRRTNVRAQKQAGYRLVIATVPLGDLSAGQLRAIAGLAAAYGDGTVRTTGEQNLLFRWVAESDVEPLYRRLVAAGLGRHGAGTIADVTSCPGAESCRLAVTQSRGLARMLGEALRARSDLTALAPDLSIKISGCPNGCGQHHVAGLGLQGSLRKIGGRALPQYFVMVGGGVGPDGAGFARLAAKVPARRLTAALEALLELYRRERRAGEEAAAFFARVEVGRVTEALNGIERLGPGDARPEDFVDLGEEDEFRPEVLEGECAT